MYHIFCLTSTLLFMKWGSLIVLITNPRDLPAFVKEMRKWQWTVMTGVNTLFNGADEHGRIRAAQFLRRSSWWSAVAPPCRKRWPSGGQQLTQHASSPRRTVSPKRRRASARIRSEAPWSGTIGLPLPSTDVSIRDEHFNRLPPWAGSDDVERHTGEICVRGPQVMQGYWNHPAETAK